VTMTSPKNVFMNLFLASPSVCSINVAAGIGRLPSDLYFEEDKCLPAGCTECQVRDFLQLCPQMH
jgi:hypothetical protein